MKRSAKLPAVLAVSLLLILAKTAGAFFAGSLSLFACAGLIMAFAFSAMPLTAKIYDTGNESFLRAQFKVLLINSILLALLSFLIIHRAFINLSVPQEINIALTCRVSIAGFIGFCFCAAILFSEIKNGNDFKALFLKYVFAAAVSIFVIIGTVFYSLKDMSFPDSAISMLLSAFVLLQAAALIRSSIKYLRKKS